MGSPPTAQHQGQPSGHQQGLVDRQVETVWQAVAAKVSVQPDRRVVKAGPKMKAEDHAQADGDGRGHRADHPAGGGDQAQSQQWQQHRQAQWLGVSGK